MNEKKKVVDEIHRSARRNFIRRKVVTKGIDDLWQGDLVEMQVYKKENKGYRYLLNVIDTFSKFAWGIPLKSKTAEDVTAAMKSILIQGRQPKLFQTDDGTEFFNRKFKALLDSYNIKHYSTFSVMKSSIVERFNRSLKAEMWKMFSLQGSYKWINSIDSLINNYNHRKHRTIGTAPINVNNKKIEKKLLKKVFNNIKIAGKHKLSIGDLVRISRYKGIFDKGYTPNWSTELFKITTVKLTEPVTYLLTDLQNKPISGGFYEFELQKTYVPDVYLVEKIIRKKGEKALVKWLGIDSSQNSWINISDVV